MNVDYKLIGERIQKARKSKGMTQDVLAELAANYITPEDLLELSTTLPEGVFEKYFGLSVLEDVLGAQEMLDLLSMDAVVEKVDGSAELQADFADLLGDEAWDLILANEEVQAVLGTTDSRVLADLIEAAGGFEAVVALFDSEEFVDVLSTVSVGELYLFLQSEELVDTVNVQTALSDAMAQISAKEGGKKQLITNIFNRFTTMLNQENVAAMYLNESQIYFNGRIDLQVCATALLSAIPDVEDLSRATFDKPFASLVLSGELRGEPVSFGITVGMMGDAENSDDAEALAKLCEKAGDLVDLFAIDVEEVDGVTGVTVSSDLSETFANLYKTALTSK